MDKGDKTKPAQLKQLKYLEHVTSQLSHNDDLSFELLIEANCIKVLEPIEVLQSINGGPYAFRTRLGWCVVGPVNGNSKNYVSCNKIAVRLADTKEVGKPFFQGKSEVQESDVSEILKQIYNHNFTEFHYAVDKEVALMYHEDKNFL